MERQDRPDLPEQLDRPYGDQEDDYVTLEPEGSEPEGGEPTGDLIADEERAAAAEARAIGEVHSSEVTSDPDEPPDDPGRGPGITWER